MMEMVEEYEVGESLELLETIRIFRKDLDRAIGRTIDTLDGGILLIGKWRMNDSDDSITDLHTYSSGQEGEKEWGTGSIPAVFYMM
jgi:hypothetical protein